MVPAELDLAAKLWRLPASRVKNETAHVVPLSPLALELIGDGFTGFGVDAAEVARKVYRSQSKVGIDQWTVHDLRRTALTKMAELGIEPIVLGHIANHRTTTKEGMTLSTYVHYGYENEKRRALKLWADRLSGIISGAAKVVPIRG
jgi:integrase